MTARTGPDVEAALRTAGRPRHYVMCPPTYFTVQYSINPWMDPDSSPVDPDVALQQWSALRRRYEQLGHTVHTVRPVAGLPDMVFAANSGTVLGAQVLGARFRAPQRAPEAEHFRQWFLAQGYRDLVMPAHVNEAEGDFAWTGRFLLAGSGFRTDPRAHAEAQEALGVPVVSLRLVDEFYYHLDTALLVLQQGEHARIAYYPDAFSAGSQQVLRRMFPDAVQASAHDAACLGLNGVSDGHNVILPAEATGLARQLSELGYEPSMLDVAELRKAGGGPKCCTLELHAADPDVRTAREGAELDGARRDGAEPDGRTGRESVEPDGTRREAVQRGGTQRGGTQRDGAELDGAEPDGRTGRESVEPDGTGREASEREGTGRVWD